MSAPATRARASYSATSASDRAGTLPKRKVGAGTGHLPQQFRTPNATSLESTASTCFPVINSTPVSR